MKVGMGVYVNSCYRHFTLVPVGLLKHFKLSTKECLLVFY